jgi:starch synthase
LYKDDPAFKNAKVVYSVYDDNFDNSLSSEFATKAIMNGMNAEHTEIYSLATNTALNLGAISYSDAVVCACENINQEVLKFVKKCNKPLLEFHSTADYENYYNLYEEIVTEELVSLV